jgi:hypothetical protein
MICEKCRGENPAEKKFCGDCGAELAAPPAAVSAGEPGLFFCARHQKVTTRVRCGHCEAPICSRCTVYGPVGARCRPCAKHRVAFRPLGALHQAGRTVGQGAQGAGRVVWYLAIWALIVNFFTGFFGGHGDA